METSFRKFFNSATLVNLVEIHEVKLEFFRRWPPFALLDDFIHKFRDKNKVESALSSYVIWGGFASETLLGALGLLDRHFSNHDIELFFNRSGEIIKKSEIYEHFTNQASQSQLEFRIGGIPIINRVPATTLLTFQNDRFAIDDGDLHVSSFAFEVMNDKVFFTSPANTLLHHIIPGAELTVKSNTDLMSQKKVFRRISRNISKSIRFKKFAHYKTDSFVAESIIQLTSRYFTTENTGQLNLQQLGDLLWREILAETSKRLFDPKKHHNFNGYFFGTFEQVLRDPLIATFEKSAQAFGWVKPILCNDTVSYCVNCYNDYK